MNETIVDQNKEIISVNELNKSAKNILERSFNNINVIGEISIYPDQVLDISTSL